MNIYNFYFRITINEQQFTASIDADNTHMAIRRIRHKYPEAETITLISGGELTSQYKHYNQTK